MRTIRRLYFYLVALISLETVIWGSVYLAQTIFNDNSIVKTPSDLAGGFSLVLVGLPIFLLHWLIAQRDARQDEDERTSRIRALFLYGVRLATLIPIVQSGMSIINRLVLQLAGMNPNDAWIGGEDTLVNNLITILVNLIVLLYIERILRSEWKNGLQGPAFPETRRLFRYIWKLYTFTLMVIGVQQMFFAVFSTANTPYFAMQLGLANSIAITLVSAPLWAGIWIFIQNQLDQPDENRSWLRLIVLHILSLGGAGTTIATAFILIKDLAIWMTGRATTINAFVNEHNWQFSLLIVAAVVWAYFSRQLQAQFMREEDVIQRAGLRRFYDYILALYGFGFLFSGILWLGFVVVDILMKSLVIESLRDGLCGSLACILAGLVVWIKRWMAAQAEAGQEGEAGDHARRSVVRKGTLYLLVFSGVVGAMGAAGALFFLLINVSLGGQEQNFTLDLLYRINILVVVGVWLAYYLNSLLKDGRFAHVSLSSRYGGFPVILLGFGEEFKNEFTQAIQRQASGLPVTVVDDPETLEAQVFESAQAVILPLALASHPSEKLGSILTGFKGKRLAVPLPQTDWIWLSTLRRSERDLARDAAQGARQLAEGQEVRFNGMGAWGIVLAIFGIIVGAEVLLRLVMIFVGLTLN